MIVEFDKCIDKNGNIDFTQDFFGRRCGLTVSGQLNVETHACALTDVYTFGPTFRAENSHTTRHLAEFWMIEPEICFAELVDDRSRPSILSLLGDGIPPRGMTLCNTEIPPGSAGLIRNLRLITSVKRIRCDVSGTWCSSVVFENFNHISHFNTHFVVRSTRASTHNIPFTLI